MTALRIAGAIVIGYALNLVLNAALASAGIVPGPVPHDNIRILSIIAVANLLVAIAAGYVAAWIAGGRRILFAMLGLMAVYAADGIRAGRHLVAIGQLPFSSAIITLLCISFVPIGAMLYANRAAGKRPRG
jgi:hypothetical protein